MKRLFRRLGAVIAPLSSCLPATGGLAAAGAVVLVSLTPFAAAQTEMPTGSRVGRPAPAYIPDNAQLTAEERGLRTTYDFGRCLLQNDKSGRLASTFTLPAKHFGESERRWIGGSSCLAEGSLRFTFDVLRGALFRARYLEQYGKSPITEFGEPIDYFKGVNRQDGSAISSASLLDFGSCVVRADFVTVHRFIADRPGTPQFAAALQELIPNLGPCMFEGMEVQFSKTNLVTILSEALYWEAQAAEAAKVQ